MRAAADALEAMLWMWMLDFWHHEHRTPTHGYAATREAAMAAFDLPGLWRVPDFLHGVANSANAVAQRPRIIMKHSSALFDIHDP